MLRNFFRISAQISKNLVNQNRKYASDLPPAPQPPTAKTTRDAKKINLISKDLELLLNKQILNELNASLTYLSMSVYYGRTSICLVGAQCFFMAMHLEELTHMKMLIDYLTMRGGTVRLFSPVVPDTVDWGPIVISIGMAAELEKQVKTNMEQIVCNATQQNDYGLADYITSTFVQEQDHSISEMTRLLTRAEQVVESSPVGEYIFDKDLYNLYREKSQLTVKPFYPPN